MIQRIQSIYLLLAALATIAFIFLPFGTVVYQGAPMTLTCTINPPLWICNAVLALVSVISIFLFSNRKLQMRIIFLTIIYSILFILLFSAGLYLHIRNDRFHPQPALLLPVFALIFNFLAYKGVKHDEELVKSMDRLR